MKIIYIAGFTGPEFVKKYCNGKEPHLAATQKIKTICRAFLMKGHEIDIISSGVTTINSVATSFQEEMIFDEGKVTVFYSSIIGFRGFNFINNFKTYFLFKNKIKKKKYDIAISCNTTEVTLLTLKQAKQYGIKTILEYEDHPLAHKKKKSFINFGIKYNVWLLNNIMSVINSLIVVSLDLVPDNFKKDVLLLQGALSDDIIIKAAKCNNKTSYSKPIQIVYTGGLELAKGVIVLINSLKYTDLEIELHIIGNGPLKDTLCEFKNEIKGNKKVVIHGYLKREEMLDYLVNSDILINPHLMNSDNSMIGKVFPFKMIEYCATGIPVISSNVGMFNSELDSYITIYNEDSSKMLAKKIEKVIVNYSGFCEKSKELKKVILEQYSLVGISRQLNDFIC